MISQCYFCFHKTLEGQLTKYIADKDVASEILRECCAFLNDNWDIVVPELGSLSNKLIKKHLKIDDLYKEEKSYANNLLLKSYDYWKQIVNTSHNPLFTALKLTVIGNIIDYGVQSVPSDIEAEVVKNLKNDFAIDDTTELLEKLQKADNILYLGDNAGEIVFDKLFLEVSGLKNVTYVVRNSPIFNDVTMQEAQDTGIVGLAKVIPNGYDGPSTLVEKCSAEFQEAFRSADVIISKGQGNLEGLMNEKRDNLYFLLMAKCSVIARVFNTDVGALIVANNKNLKNGF